jgi:low temperature requirement protein LtrA
MPVPSRPHAPDPEYEVTPLELFFDLVFALAVSQLSHHLLAHLSWRGAAETLVMLRAV